MSAKAYDVVVIGGGIVGAACAAECAAEEVERRDRRGAP